ncbi:hypothetical protein CYMTET_45338 [Cymbomonas tetramitiformis]|uniref:Apple domain-containing protein n=1 Tax=Cymbomonas tetramitiformis TaxID=36881 RepID=A0AAE0C067_9CHLO|nr:hypothetical protein CYMTET_45338 [Cymbomonas tetramitiformis]
MKKNTRVPSRRLLLFSSLVAGAAYHAYAQIGVFMNWSPVVDRLPYVQRDAGFNVKSDGTSQKVPDCAKVVTPESRYDPLDDIHGHNRSTEQDVRSCRRRCASVDGCAFFSFWQRDGRCQLSTSSAKLVMDELGGVAGPVYCAYATRKPARGETLS